METRPLCFPEAQTEKRVSFRASCIELVLEGTHQCRRMAASMKAALDTEEPRQRPAGLQGLHLQSAPGTAKTRWPWGGGCASGSSAGAVLPAHTVLENGSGVTLLLYGVSMLTASGSLQGQCCRHALTAGGARKSGAPLA